MSYFDKYIEDNPQEMESPYIKLDDGTVIDVEKIVLVSDLPKEYVAEDGTVRQYARKQYEFEDSKIMEVPISVHSKMMILHKEYADGGHTVTCFKIKKQGSGIQTKYDVIPVLSKNKHGADHTLKIDGE